MISSLPGAFNGRPGPSVRHPGGGWGSQNQVQFEGPKSSELEPLGIKKE